MRLLVKITLKGNKKQLCRSLVSNNLHRELNAKQILIVVIFQFPLHYQLYLEVGHKNKEVKLVPFCKGSFQK